MSPLDDSPSAGVTVPPSQAIIEAVADCEDVDVTEIEPPTYEPLYAVVNPDALDSLVQTASSSDRVRITLEYEGYDVVVDGDGAVEISDGTTADDSVSNSLEE